MPQDFLTGVVLIDIDLAPSETLIENLQPSSTRGRAVYGLPVGQILETISGLALWLRRVFWVMGGYIATTGVLVLYVANTGLRAGDAGTLGVLALAGATSLGWMAAVNFMLGSDFRWALLGLGSIWVVALLLGLTTL